MGAQVTASALLAEMRVQSVPASIQSIPTNGDNQDVVTMGTIGARRTAHLIALFEQLLAIDALMVAQALELRGDTVQRSDAVEQLYRWVRCQAPALESDRALSAEIEHLAECMRASGELTAHMPAFDDAQKGH